MYYVLPIGKVAALNVSMLAFSFKDMQTEMILGNELLSMTSPLLVDHMPLHLKASNMTLTYHKTMKFAPPYLIWIYVVLDFYIPPKNFIWLRNKLYMKIWLAILISRPGNYLQLCTKHLCVPTIGARFWSAIDQQNGHATCNI